MSNNAGAIDARQVPANNSNAPTEIPSSQTALPTGVPNEAAHSVVDAAVFAGTTHAAPVQIRDGTTPLSLVSNRRGIYQGTQPPLRPNRLTPPSLTMTERIMLRRPRPSPRSQRNRRGAPLRRLFRLPRDLSLITSLGLIALIAVCSLALIQVGSATAQMTCPPSGGGSKP